MAGKTLDLDTLLYKDQLACRIAENWVDWDMRRASKISDWNEVRQYVYQTDTTQTTNSKLPWKNKTTLPKLCQIRDNLYANYMISMFPKRRWLFWEGGDEASEDKDKKEAIKDYIAWCIDRTEFKEEVEKLVLDYIDYGNCFGTVEWMDERQQLEDKLQVGYVGPVIRRLSPLDVVMNPAAPSFKQSPKIVRSLISLGELAKLIDSFSTTDNQEQYKELFNYLINLRQSAGAVDSVTHKDAYFSMDGFTDFRSYLQSDYAEVLTFYGDIYDIEARELLRNHEILVVDRHKLISKRPNPSFFGHAPMYHAGWRARQDNLWAMGPLDNLVGLQYRIDHLENMKADLMDLTVLPPLKIKGYVDDFEWGPMQRIYVGDEGDVEIMSPDVQALNVNLEIQNLEMKMEEMAGAPKEAMGFRTPGEKTKYEVQRLENAASRIFQSKIGQFEEKILEPLLNAMLELARRNMDSTQIRVFDDEFKIATFETLTPEDITGTGRIRPVAARHFAEQAERLQNIAAFKQAASTDPGLLQHFSTIQEAKMMEELLELEDWKLVEPYIRLTEEADAQRLMNVHQESVAMEAGTPAGIAPDDADLDE